MRDVRTAGLAAAAVLAVAGCGGGDASGGIDRLGITSGPINGFGSIIVDGLRYETGAGTVFILDDAPGLESELRVGQVVTIHWRSRDDGRTFRAETVRYDDSVEGPVSTVDAPAGRLVVLGQTVLVDADTSFDAAIQPNDITGLAPGDALRVSGLPDATGTIRATRITRDAAPAELEVRGIVGSVSGNTFTINALTVNASGLAQGAQDCADGQINPGDYVEARGNTLNGQGQLVATVVECEDGHIPAGTTGEFGNLVGYVTDFQSPASFRVAGTAVDASGAGFIGGTVAELGDNVRVKVRGMFNAAGVLVADTLEFKPTGPAATAAGVQAGGQGHGQGNDQGNNPGNGQGNGQGPGNQQGGLSALIEAELDAVNPATGSLVIAGIPVVVDATTRLEDQTGGTGHSFGLGHLVPGDLLQVRGFEQGGSGVRARLLERRPPDGNLPRRLRGSLGAVEAPGLRVLGRQVLALETTVFRRPGNATLTGDEFFGQVTPGDLVEVSYGAGAGDPIPALEVTRLRGGP